MFLDDMTMSSALTTKCDAVYQVSYGVRQSSDRTICSAMHSEGLDRLENQSRSQLRYRLGNQGRALSVSAWLSLMDCDDKLDRLMEGYGCWLVVSGSGWARVEAIMRLR